MTAGRCQNHSKTLRTSQAGSFFLTIGRLAEPVLDAQVNGFRKLRLLSLWHSSTCYKNLYVLKMQLSPHFKAGSFFSLFYLTDIVLLPSHHLSIPTQIAQAFAPGFIASPRSSDAMSLPTATSEGCHQHFP